MRTGCWVIRPVRHHVHATSLGLVLFTGMASASFWQQPPGGAAKKIPAPRFRGIAPSVAVSSSGPTTIRVRGTGLSGLSKVIVAACDGSRVDLPLTSQTTTQLTFVLPASLLAKPCVLRVSSEIGGDFPLGVADVKLARLKPPAYDPNSVNCWGGMFNQMFGSVQVTLPNPDDAIVGINFTEPRCAPIFVLGKNDTTLFRVVALPQKNNDESDELTLTLLLPGVRRADVQWGSKDKENFWLGTLSEDGSQILVRQSLSDMSLELAGPLDKD